MNQCMLILRQGPGSPGSNDMGADERQTMVAAYNAWIGKLAAGGQLVGGNKLTPATGRVVGDSNGKPIVNEGSFGQARDYVNGYFIVHAEDCEEATGMALDCPHLRYGGTIEIRQVEETGGG